MHQDSVSVMRALLKCGTQIPLWHYDSDGQLLDTDAEHLVLDKILDFIGSKAYMLEYAKTRKSPLILSSDMGLMWGAVFQTEKESLRGIYLIGPVYNAEVSVAILEGSADRYHIDGTFRRQYIATMKSISVVPSLMFQQYCLMLHYCVSGQSLNRSDIQFQPRNKVMNPPPPESESSDTDRTRIYIAEQALLRMLREGDANYKDAVIQADHLFNPQFPKHRESLQKAIVTATSFASLCIREAIQSGIAADTAYAIGEGYIESMLQCKSLSDLASLSLSMFEDFIFRIRKNRTNPNVCAQIRSCRDYIELHAERELKLSTLAKQAGYSEYYLSRKFKQEMGTSIGAYIKLVRIERSKLMLVSSKLTIAQIAENLHFASSSHFSESFREIVGKTPQQYRSQNQRY